MKKSYQEIAKKNSPKENVIANAVVAFISGGIMGIIGQFLIDTYSAWLDISTKEATVCMLVTLIFFSCLFTSLDFLINGLISVNVDLLFQLQVLLMRR